MKKISNLTLLGYILGITFSLGSFIRYYIIWYDLDRAIVYVSLGIIVCAIAWIYNRLRNQAHTVEAMSEHLADRRSK